jgi:hypothetical protein
MVKFADMPKFMPGGNYQCDIGLGYLKEWIKHEKENYGIDMDPDFQRGHVWTMDQRIAYMEYLIKGGTSSYMIQWNCPVIQSCRVKGTGDLDNTLVLVDGKQRIKTALMFLDDKVPVWGNLLSEFEDKWMVLAPAQVRFRMCINNLSRRVDLLRWYLELNEGGTVHTQKELVRVRAMLDAEVKKKGHGT